MPKRDKANECHIYCLTDPDTGLVRYVGSALDPFERLGQHRKTLAGPVGKWLDGLRRKGCMAGLKSLEVVPLSCVAEAERRWIVHFAEIGAPLLNTNMAPRKPTPVLDELSPILTVQDVAALKQVDATSVRRAIIAGTLQGSRKGKVYLIMRQSAEEWMPQRRGRKRRAARARKAEER